MELAEAVLRFGEFCIDPVDERLWRGNSPIKLGNKAFCVLLLLARNPDRLITKDELFETVWDGTLVSESALTSVIKELRRALGDDTRSPLFIESVYGRGYRFIAATEAAPNPVEIPVPPASLPVASPSPAAEPAGGPSVAVLAFANLTGDPANDYLSDGIAEEIITTLSRASNLKVPARTSSFAYRGRNLDARTIGRELGVSTILEGSVRLGGNRVRIGAQLIEASSGFHLWAQSYDRVLDDLLALQDDIASAVATALQAKLGAASAPAPDREAYHLYLQANMLSAKLTRESLGRALELYDRSISRDPGFARPRAGLARTLMLAVAMGFLPLDRRLEAKERVEEAIQLDPSHGLPYAVRSVLDVMTGRWLDAEANFRTALELDPREPSIPDAIALHLLAPCGHLRRAYERACQAIDLAPATDYLRLNCAGFALLSGQVDEAEAQFESAARLGVSQRSLFTVMKAELAGARGRTEEAATTLTQVLAAVEPLRLAGADQLCELVPPSLAGRADPAAASAAIALLVERTSQDNGIWRFLGTAGLLVRWQVRLGALDAAFAIMDRMVEAWRRSGYLSSMNLNQLWWAEMRPFREDPRFQDLVEQLGLMSFWKTHGPPDGHRLKGGKLIVL
jgi:TolB-like protein/Tfp pilus assembly protein PilF